MNRAFGLALFVAGVILIIAGFNASQSISSDVSRLFTGTITDKALWMLVGGACSAIAGSVLLSRQKSHE